MTIPGVFVKQEPMVVRAHHPKTPWEVRVKTEPVPATDSGRRKKNVAVKREPQWSDVKREKDVAVKQEKRGDGGDEGKEEVELVRKSNTKPWEVIVIEDDDEDKKDKDSEAVVVLPPQVEESLRKGVASVQRARRVDSERKSHALSKTAGGFAEERPHPAWEDERADPQQLVPPPASWELDRSGNDRRPEEEERLVCLKNYAAIGVDYYTDDAKKNEQSEARTQRRGGGCYGLIDRGARVGGLRMLIMHVKKEGGRPLLDRIRPGSTLLVQSTLSGGVGGTLRVRYTTPARYYSPGERVTTLAIGVDAVSWQSLVPKRRRI